MLTVGRHRHLLTRAFLNFTFVSGEVGEPCRARILLDRPSSSRLMARSTHLLSNGDAVWMNSFTGTVVASNETSNTVVHQNEYLQNVGGSWIRTPGAVQSTVVTTHKIWLKASEGSERDFDLSSVPLALREGHDVSVVWIGKEGLTSSVIVAAINHTTKARYLLNVAKAGFAQVYKALKLKNPGMVQWCVGGAMLLLVVVIKGSNNFLPGLFIGFCAAVATGSGPHGRRQGHIVPDRPVRPRDAPHGPGSADRGNKGPCPGRKPLSDGPSSMTRSGQCASTFPTCLPALSGGPSSMTRSGTRRLGKAVPSVCASHGNASAVRVR